MSVAVFFDLDGTLSDPKIGITRCIRHALDCLGVDCPSDEELTRYIGPPLLGSFETIAGRALAPKALEYYRERFSEVGWKENTVYPGVAESLRQLAESDRPMYVATSKPSVFADRIIRHFELEQYFARIFGSELDGTRSNKIELLRFAVSETDWAGQAVMVGDREHDILGAKANNMGSIGVTYGYGNQQELQSAGADAVVHSPEALLQALGLSVLEQ